MKTVFATPIAFPNGKTYHVSALPFTEAGLRFDRAYRAWLCSDEPEAEEAFLASFSDVLVDALRPNHSDAEIEAIPTSLDYGTVRLVVSALYSGMIQRRKRPNILSRLWRWLVG